VIEDLLDEQDVVLPVRRLDDDGMGRPSLLLNAGPPPGSAADWIASCTLGWNAGPSATGGSFSSGAAHSGLPLMIFARRAAAGTIASRENPLNPSIRPDRGRAFLYIGWMARAIRPLWRAARSSSTSEC
jgi:hypothetical protein